MLKLFEVSVAEDDGEAEDVATEGHSGNPQVGNSL